MQMSTDMFAYVVHLLETYRSVQQKIAVLRYELSHPSNIHPNEMLAALAYPKQSLDAHTPAGHISDRTFYIAVNYQEKASAANQDSIASVSSQLMKLERRVTRLKHCVLQLPESHRIVIQGIYFHKRGLKDLADELHISERTVQRYRNNGIQALTEMYQTLKNTGTSLE